jgi:acyl dehydratase
MFYLDDLSVGMLFRTATHTVDEEQIIRFAREFDPQPFHLSDADARATLFGGLAASGWHTAAITMRLMVENAPFAGGIIGAGGDINWPRPTRPGDTLQVFSEVTDILPSRSRPDRGVVTVRNETRNQHGEPVQVFTSKVVVAHRPASGA